MNKLFAAVISGVLVLSAASLMANSKLLKAHKGYKGAKTISKCADCHNETTKLERKKGQDYKAIQTTSSCAGAGCHK